ncbi:MAG: EamA family transporter [Methanospirillum sp.]|uniref:EamA family transporter n=1 Tax=Methanospirillum sp. TaxID=45200 RepID=UPI002373A6A9|nr:EamA family transporter [Methanospirillum sp.]MDD1728689.1 EamA family transporter [Methanospirillum sp.]
MDTLLIILIAIVFSALGQVALKNGMLHFGAVNDLSIQGIISMFLNPYVLGGLCLYGISTIFWLVALSQKDLSYVYPFVALTICLVLVFSKYFFNEQIGPYRFAGIIVIICGLALLIKSG